MEKGIELDNEEFIGTKTLPQDLGINDLPGIQEDYFNAQLE